MERSGLTAQDNRRLEIAAQAVIVSAQLSDNSTGINWRRLPSTSLNDHYLTEYPGLTNQAIALCETLEEVERRVIEHELDLDRIDNAGLQESIEDVLNDILDFMVHDAQASSSDGDSDADDSSGSDDSDRASDSDYPPNMFRSESTHNSGSDAVLQAHHHHHEAGGSSSSRESPHIQGPHVPFDAIQPISVPAEEHMPSSNPDAPTVEGPQRRQNEIRDEAREPQGRGVNCCPTM